MDFYGKLYEHYNSETWITIMLDRYRAFGRIVEINDEYLVLESSFGHPHYIKINAINYFISVPSNE